MMWNYIRSFALVAASASMMQASALNVQTGEQPQFSLSYLNAHASPPNEPRFRLPPSFSDPPFSPDSWDKVPDYWNYGVWYFVATSSALLSDWTNIQWEMTPLSLDNQSAPSVEGQEFFYFELLGVPVKLYGTTWPLAPDSYHSTLPGAGAVINNVWEFIAWGYDSKGVPYALLYETQAGPLPPSISLLSRSNGGVAEDTYELLREGLRNLGNADLTQLADDLYNLPHNHNNDGEPYPTCGSTCKLNLLVDLPVNLSFLDLSQ